MKKSILALAVVLGASTTFAQDLTSKKGENYLPQAGDYAIGIDAVPVLNYIGNFFGKTNDNTYAGGIWNFNNPNMTITGKYFVEDGMAYRLGLRLGWGSQTSKVMVDDRTDNPATNPWPEVAAEVENKMKMSATNINLTAGLEWRKGTTRLQGFYGAEVGIMLGASGEKYTYGNELSNDVTTPIAVTAADDFGGNINTITDGSGALVDSRNLTVKNGLTFGLGVRAFIGAEYFIIPKLSLGGEFGWGIGFMMQGKSTITSEALGTRDGATALSVEEISSEGAKSSSFGFDTQNVNPLFGPVGRLNLTFHF